MPVCVKEIVCEDKFLRYTPKSLQRETNQQTQFQSKRPVRRSALESVQQKRVRRLPIKK
jgi:hypothetical protein